MPNVSREQALGAMFGMIESSRKIADVATAHAAIMEEPGTKELLESCAIAINGLAHTAQISFERALEAEDALNKVIVKLDEYFETE